MPTKFPCRLHKPPNGSRGGFVALVLLVALGRPLAAHEPIFGIGPHTIFKGGVGIELEAELDRASGAGSRDNDAKMVAEIIYGLTADWALTLVVPSFLDRQQASAGPAQSASGLGDLALRTKHRFWRRDTLGVQDSAAWVVGIKLPTGDHGSDPPLGSGSTDVMIGLTAAHEARRWYFFGDVRIMRPGRGAGGLRGGMAIFADVAVGLRPRLTGYTETDMVYLLELNWESNRRARQGRVPVPGSAAERLFLSPGFFYTFANYALKGGIQFPISEDLDGGGPAADWRASLAFEVHL